MALHIKKANIEKPLFLGGKEWMLEGLNEITVLFGKNGSGKSALLRNLKKQNQKSFHYASPERAGEISHDVGIMQKELSVETRTARNQNLAPTYRQEAISRIQVVLVKIGHLHGRRQESPVYIHDIENLLGSLLPDFQLEITGGNPVFKLTRIDNDDEVTTVGQLSSGETEVLVLALDLLTMCSIWAADNQKEGVLLIDEPDMHLHPELQQHLAKFLVRLLDKYNVQIIVATHSTTLLSALGHHGGTRTSVAYLSNSKQIQKAKKFERTLQELSACLGGHALMGPLFSAPLLLVEGDDDDQIWSQVSRYGEVKLAIIPCNGTEILDYQKKLEEVFSSLMEHNSKPLGYALLDGDQSLPEESDQKPQKHIKFIQLCCHESENLFLSDEVLQELGMDWKTAKLKIIEESGNCGKKEAMLKSCNDWDRKKEDIKNVITELSKILDPKNVLWTRRVAKSIGIKKPEGQLAEFLGHDVLKALWPE